MSQLSLDGDVATCGGEPKIAPTSNGSKPISTRLILKVPTTTCDITITLRRAFVAAVEFSEESLTTLWDFMLKMWESFEQRTPLPAHAFYNPAMASEVRFHLNKLTEGFDICLLEQRVQQYLSMAHDLAAVQNSASRKLSIDERAIEECKADEVVQQFLRKKEMRDSNLGKALEELKSFIEERNRLREQLVQVEAKVSSSDTEVEVARSVSMSQ